MRAFLLAALCLLLPSAAWPGDSAELDALVKRAEFDAGKIRDMGDGPLVSELDVGDLSTRASFAGLIRIDGEKAFGVAGSYVILIDRMLFDGELNGFERKLLGRGLKMDLDKRLRFIRSLAGKEAR